MYDGRVGLYAGFCFGTSLTCNSMALKRLIGLADDGGMFRGRGLEVRFGHAVRYVSPEFCAGLAMGGAVLILVGGWFVSVDSPWRALVVPVLVVLGAWGLLLAAFAGVHLRSDGKVSVQGLAPRRRALDRTDIAAIEVRFHHEDIWPRGYADLRDGRAMHLVGLSSRHTHNGFRRTVCTVCLDDIVRIQAVATALEVPVVEGPTRNWGLGGLSFS